MAGGFWGGVATGIGNGFNLVKESDEIDDARRKAQNAKDAQGILLDAADRVPGQMYSVDDTPEAAMKAALAKSQPQAGPITRWMRAAATGLRVGDAAQASGVTPPPASVADVNAVAGLPASSGAPAGAPATGMPADTTGVAPVEVTPPKGRIWTKADSAREFLAATARLGDPAATQAAFKNYSDAADQDLIDHITSIKSPEQLVNHTNDLHGDNKFDYEPAIVNGKQQTDANGSPLGVYSYDGKPLGGPMSLFDAKLNAIREVKGDPLYGLKDQLAIGDNVRQDRAERSTEDYRKADLAIRAQEAASMAAYHKAAAGNLGVQGQIDQAKLAEIGQNLSFNKRWNDLLQDPVKNAHELTSMVDEARKDPTKMIMGADGEPVSPYELQAKQAITAGEREFRSNPYTQYSVIKGDTTHSAVSLVNSTDPQTGNPAQRWVVQGVPGSVANYQQALMLARKLYPGLAKLKVPPPKRANATH